MNKIYRISRLKSFNCLSRSAYLLLSLVTCFLSLFLVGCETLSPYVQDFNIVSVQDEVKMGQMMQVEVAKEMQLVSTASQVNRVNSIGQRLVKALPQQIFQHKFYVVKDDTPNAFTIPGGTIYVHTGLLNLVKSEDELAGVMAHELGHAYERHPAKSVSRAYGLDYISQILFKNQASNFRKITLQIIKGGVLTNYSREDEREADEVGFYLLRRAGYSEDGLLHFLQRLQKMSQGRQIPTFLSSHPATSERIQRLEQLSRNVAQLQQQSYR